MTDYKTMYHKLFSTVTDVMEALNNAQLETEEIYVDSSGKDENKIVNLELISSKEA